MAECVYLTHDNINQTITLKISYVGHTNKHIYTVNMSLSTFLKWRVTILWRVVLMVIHSAVRLAHCHLHTHIAVAWVLLSSATRPAHLQQSQTSGCRQTCHNQSSLTLDTQQTLGGHYRLLASRLTPQLVLVMKTHASHIHTNPLIHM